MKEKKFSLSKKIVDMDNDWFTPYYWADDIKEFIEEEGRLIIQLKMKVITWEEFCDKRKKLAGENFC